MGLADLMTSELDALLDLTLAIVPLLGKPVEISLGLGDGGRLRRLRDLERRDRLGRNLYGLASQRAVFQANLASR